MIIRIIFVFCLSAPLTFADDLGFRFKDGRCVNTDGTTEGLNPKFLGECGDLRGEEVRITSCHEKSCKGIRLDNAKITLSSDSNELNFSFATLDGATVSAEDSARELEKIAFTGASLKKSTFRDITLTKAGFQDVDLTDSTFVNAQLPDADFNKSDLSRTKFTNVRSPRSSFSLARLDNSDLGGSDLTESKFTVSFGMDTNFLKASLARAVFEGSFFEGSNFDSSDLKESKFTNATLSDNSFIDAALNNADLSDANVSFCDFTRADLTSSKLIGTEGEGTIFFGSQLKEANLTNANLQFANFESSFLEKTKFLGANLEESSFTKAKGTETDFNLAVLRKADLSKAQIISGNFKKSKMENTNLAEADLSKSQFRGAILSRANVEDSTFSESTYDHRTTLPFDTSEAESLGMLFLKIPQFLIITDTLSDLVKSFKEELEKKDIEVTFSTQLEKDFQGGGLSDADVAFHINGTGYREDMPEEGQEALVEFVKNGGLFIHGEWNAYEISIGNLKKMNDLCLFTRQSAGLLTNLISITPEYRDHPITQGIRDFSVRDATANRGAIREFSENPSITLATSITSSSTSPMLAIRNFEKGKVLGFGIAFNYRESDGGLRNPNIIQMIANAVEWAVE